MSVHRDRDAWRVVYRVNGKQRSRSFARQSDAKLFDADVKRKRALGHDLVRELNRSALTLDAFVRGGFRTHVATLAGPTRAKYAWALELHLSELADEPLVVLDVPRLAAHQQHLLKRGRTASTVREVMTRLSGILQIAVEHGDLLANPVRSLRKVPAEAIDDVQVLSPAQVERVIAALTGRERAIAVLAGHLGLRPVELRLATWSAFNGATFTVGKARTKATSARTRVIDVPAITARELNAWRLESGGRGDDLIVGAASANALSQWGVSRLRRVIVEAGGHDGATLYSLRHSHASALHYAGFTPGEAARRMGHGLALHWKTSAHVIESLSGERYDGLDALIAAARVAPELRKQTAE